MEKCGLQGGLVTATTVGSARDEVGMKGQLRSMHTHQPCPQLIPQPLS